MLCPKCEREMARSGRVGGGRQRWQCTHKDCEFRYLTEGGDRRKKERRPPPCPGATIAIDEKGKTGVTVCGLSRAWDGTANGRLRACCPAGHKRVLNDAEILAYEQEKPYPKRKIWGKKRRL